MKQHSLGFLTMKIYTIKIYDIFFLAMPTGFQIKF